MERKELGESGEGRRGQGSKTRMGKIEEDESLKREEGHRQGRRREGWLEEGKFQKIEWSALQTRSNLCIPRNKIAQPHSQNPHSCIFERFIYQVFP